MGSARTPPRARDRQLPAGEDTVTGEAEASSGFLDFVRIYEHPLTTQEVATLAAAAATPEVLPSVSGGGRVAPAAVTRLSPHVSAAAARADGWSASSRNATCSAKALPAGANRPSSVASAGSR